MKEVAILPDQVPVMPLPGAVLFRTPCSRFTFSSRAIAKCSHTPWRTSECSASHSSGPSSAQWKSEDDFFDVGTIGLIRACVGRGDGTSNLILQGLQRVCFADFVQLHPFPIAEFETLRSDNETTVETDALGAKVLELYARFKTIGRQLPTKIDRYVTDMTDLAMLADLMASTFIEDPVRRQQVLEELDLNTRLRLVIQYLRDETGNAAA